LGSELDVNRLYRNPKQRFYDPKDGLKSDYEIFRLKESLPPLSLEDIEAELQKSFGRGKSMAVCQCFKRLGICEKGGSK
jgi:hypothetical protein